MHFDPQNRINVEDFIANFDELELCHLSLDAMTAEQIRSPVSAVITMNSSLYHSSYTATA